MTQKNSQLPNHNEWKSLPSTTKIYIVWRIFKTAHLPIIETTILKKLSRVDLWLFPPIGYISCYKTVALLFPVNHPMTYIAIHGTAIMFTALALLLLRPHKKNIAHWV